MSGLGLINALLCPHYDTETARQKSLKALMKKTPGAAIALDDCAAIEIIDGQYRVITSKPKARAYKIYWSKGRYRKKVIPAIRDYMPLNYLLNK